MSQVNSELGRSATATISLNETAVRNLAGVGSGTISMSNLQGKSNVFTFAIASNQINANLRTLAVNAGWNQSSAVTATINGGVWISGSEQANSTPALTINGSFPNGVTLINNGAIAGRGGTGGNGAWQSALGTAGAAGGLALAVSVGVTIQNNGTIAGGGGGGGGALYGYNAGVSCNMSENFSASTSAGGGGGGGQSNASYNGNGGAAFGTYVTGCTVIRQAAPGGAGTTGGPGAGGIGGQASCVCSAAGTTGGTGGNGGSWGNAGASVFYAGGGAGAAITGNGNISWTAFGTRLGPIS